MFGWLGEICYVIFELIRGLILRISDAIFPNILNNNPPPPSKYLLPQYFQNDKGMWIYQREWLTLNDIRGIIFIIHGLNQHIDNYNHIALYFNNLGFICFGIDLYGFGRSNKINKYSTYSYDLNDYINDYILFYDKISNNNKYSHIFRKYPRFLYGHNIGGLIAIKIGLKTSNNNNNYFNGGIILSSPLINLPFKYPHFLHPNINQIIFLLFKLLNYFTPKSYVSLINYKYSDNNYDNSAQYHLQNDPLINNKQSIPIHLAYEILINGNDVISSAESINYPLLCFLGCNDIIYFGDSIKLFYDKISSKNKNIKFFDDIYNDPSIEIRKNQLKYLDYVSSWLLSQCDSLKTTSYYINDFDEKKINPTNLNINNSEKKLNIDYDDLNFQINVLNNDILRIHSLNLLNENEITDNKDSGLIMFINKFISGKILQKIFNRYKSQIIISSSSLINILAMTVLLYKIKAYQIKNNGKKPKKMNNELVKKSVKHLSVWIIRTFGNKTNKMQKINNKPYYIYNFKLTKNDFKQNMIKYLTKYRKVNGKHSDSTL